MFHSIFSRTTLIAFFVGTSFVAFAADTDKAKPLPNVLIIGDSISIGYMKPLTELLAGKANVVHNEGNATYSGNGLAKLDEWLGNTKWDVIHFNHGLHDLKYVDEKGVNTPSKDKGHIQVPLDQYKKNMEAIVARLKKTGAKLIFATTTPFPDKVDGPLREVADVTKYNAAALEIMKRENVAVDDLYSLVLPQMSKIQQPKNVHFTDEGYKVLAQQAAKHILDALGKPLKKANFDTAKP